MTDEADLEVAAKCGSAEEGLRALATRPVDVVRLSAPAAEGCAEFFERQGHAEVAGSG